MPTISVIVPVYNAQKHIHRCVDSILAQTFTDFELILVDDGSPDNCGAICDEYAAKDIRIRVIHQENQGQAAARNHAVAVTRGEWVCFVDSDDMIHPQMLEHLHRAAQESNVGISTCGAMEAETVPADFNVERPYSYHTMQMDEVGLQNMYKTGAHRYWVIWGKLIKKEIVEKIPFEVGRIYEDNAVACRWLQEAKVIANSENRYYFYQMNPRGTTKKAFQLKHLDLLWALEEQINFYESVGYQQMKRKICAYYLTTAAWYSHRVRYELKRPDRAGEIRRDMLRLLEENPMDTLTLTDEEQKSIHDALHPHIAQIRRLPKVCASVLRSGGMKALAERVRRRLSRAKE